MCINLHSSLPLLQQPAWGIRLILEALISFLPTPADGALGALDWTSEERKKLARESLKFRCPVCCCEGTQTCVDLLPKIKTKGGDGKKKTKFQEEIEKLKMLQFQNHASSIDEDTKEERSTDKKKEGESKEEDDSEEDKKQAHPKDGDEGDTTSANPSSTSPPQTENKEPTSNVETGGEKETKLVEDSAAQSKVSPEASQQTSTDDTTTPTDATTPPLPANSNSAQPAVTDDTVPAANTETTVADIVADAPIISDSILNTMIGFFAVIVLVLLRQAQTLVDELQSLGGVEE